MKRIKYRGLRYSMLLCLGLAAPLSGASYTTVDLVVAHPPDPRTDLKYADAHSKLRVPVGISSGCQNTLTSVIKQANPKIVRPSTPLFPSNAALNQLLEQFLHNIENKDTYFTVFLTKIRLVALHRLYIYLTKIYTVFNMTHIDALDEYLEQEEQWGLTRKTLIIDHLINIIEAQLNQAILAQFPGGLPKHIATYAGTMLMKHDYGADLDIMIKGAENRMLLDPSVKELVKPTIDTNRTVYQGLLADYMTFFDRYTQLIKPFVDAQGGHSALNEFVQYAHHIRDVVQKATPTVDPNLKPAQKIKELRTMQPLNPPLFFYDDQSLRALALIPELAASLPEHVVSVPWPKALVDAASKGTRLKDKFGWESPIAIAYFTDKKGKVTTNKAQAASLYVNIPTMQYIYAQEILVQPEWLNKQEGILRMVRACAGNFAALFHPLFDAEYIFDPCLECILRNAAAQANLVVSSAPKICKACDDFMKGVENALNAIAVPDQTGTIGDGTVDPNSLGGDV